MTAATPSVPRASGDPLPELAAFLRPYAALFHNRQSWRSVERYLTGLLTDLSHKNCQTVADAVAGTSTERLQHLLTDAVWDAQAVDRARVQTLVAHSPPSSAAGILVLDDTGLPKLNCICRKSGRVIHPGGGAPRCLTSCHLLRRRTWRSRSSTGRAPGVYPSTWWSPTPAMATPRASWPPWSSGRCRMSVPWARRSGSGSRTTSAR